MSHRRRGFTDAPVPVQRVPSRAEDLAVLDSQAADTVQPASYPALFHLPSASPSAADGATAAEEEQWRHSGAALIRAAGFAAQV